MANLNKKITIVVARFALTCALCVGCSALLTSTAWAGDVSDGVAAAQKGDFATALNLWQPLAERGDAAAQYNLGLMYDNGQGVAQDYKAAVKWYTAAAEQGLAKAQSNLGVMYDNGQGVAQDYKAAMKWYTAAAEQGNANAQSNLGVMYEYGIGVIQSFVKAHALYNIAASSGKTPKAIKNRDIIAQTMTPAQIAQAQELATRCMKSNYKDCD